MRADIHYFSDGRKIAAHLYRPADWKPGDPPRPGTVPDNPKPPMTLEAHDSEEVLELDLESVEACFRYRPEWVVGRISPRPVLFIYGEEDVIVPPSEAHACHAACGEPKKIVMLPKGRITTSTG